MLIRPVYASLRSRMPAVPFIYRVHLLKLTTRFALGTFLSSLVRSLFGWLLKG